MVLPNDLIASARQLVQLHEKRPRQANLRRVLSTAYYSLFYGLAETAADRMIGTNHKPGDGWPGAGFTEHSATLKPKRPALGAAFPQIQKI